MQTLVVASQKGGTGKTTLAACLGAEASLHLGRVALADLDPQQSLAMWHALREQKDKPELAATGARIGSALDRVSAQASCRTCSLWTRRPAPSGLPVAPLSGPASPSSPRRQTQRV